MKWFIVLCVLLLPACTIPNFKYQKIAMFDHCPNNEPIERSYTPCVGWRIGDHLYATYPPLSDLKNEKVVPIQTISRPDRGGGT